MVCLLVCGATTVVLGASLDQTLSEKNRSYAPSLEGKAVIHQMIGQLERAVQQKDWESFSALFSPDMGDAKTSAQYPDLQSRFRNMLVRDGDTSDVARATSRNWRLTGFRNFRFQVDSVTLNGQDATAYLTGTWSNIGDVRSPDSLFQLGVNLTSGRPCFRSPDAVLAIIGSFVETDSYLNGLTADKKAGSANSPRESNTAAGDFDSPLLFGPVNWWQDPVVPRVTRTVSQQKIASGLDLFGCVSGITSYLYIDADDFAADLVASSDECWRRVVVMDDKQEYLVAKGHYGTGNTLEDFAAPRGMEFCGPGLLYITEDANNRIKILLVSTQSNDHLDLFKFITMSQFNHPQDLDVSLPNQYSYKRTVVVANTGGNNILAFTDEEPLGHGAVTVQSGIGTTVGAFNRPTSIAFGRDPLTSEKTYWCYFIDSGNKRVVKIGSVFNAPSNNSYEAYDDFPDPLTDLSGIGVDNKGEVWVVDRGLGRIYKFTSSLVPIATHGMTGTADGEYLHPTSISFTEGYEYGVGPIANLGEVVLGEEWGEDTGIRRLVSGTEIFDPHLYYYPKLADGTSPAHLSGDYFITGYSNLTEQYITPNGITYTNTFNVHASGLEPFNFTLPTGSPSGTYRVKITAQSIYQNSNTDSITLSISVDVSAVNQLPVVTCIYFPNGDTRFQPDIGQPISAIAHDADGSIANYFWSCDPANAGDFSNPYANPTYLTVYPSSGKLINERFVRVRVTDNYGQYSTYRSVDIGQCPITQCQCDACGDANSDGSVDISDVVFLIAHIFSGGVAPAECNYAKGKGDANGDGSVDISDVVYLIARIFSGGRPPYCQVR